MKEGSIVGSGKNMLAGQFAEMSDISNLIGYGVKVLFGTAYTTSVEDYTITLTDADVPVILLLVNAFSSTTADIIVTNSSSHDLKASYIQYLANVGKFAEIDITSGGSQTVSMLASTANGNSLQQRGLCINSPILITIAS